MDEPPNVEISLDQIEGQTAAFLDLAEAIGRPLLPAESNAFRWLLRSFEAPSIQARFAELQGPQLDYYARLLMQLGAVLDPSGARLSR